MTLRLSLMLCLGLLQAVVASASSLRIDPVQIVVSEDQRASVVTLTNEGASPITVHAYALEWSQIDGSDRYTDTSELIVSPPITTIPAKSTQVVRVGFRDRSAAHGAWRLIVEEIPQRSSKSGGVQVALRMSLPLFAQLEPANAEDLRWTAWQAADGAWLIEALNSTDGYVRLTPANFADLTGIQHDASIRLGVVLPQSRLRWRLRIDPTLVDATQFQRLAGTEGFEDGLAVASSRH